MIIVKVVMLLVVIGITLLTFCGVGLLIKDEIEALEMKWSLLGV